MPPDKAQFGSRNLSTPAFKTKSNTVDKREYAGADRRLRIRRENADRREEVRFDLAGDRREGLGRRKDDAPPSLW